MPTNNKLQNLLKNNSNANTDIQRGAGYQLSTETPVAAPPAPVAPGPQEKQKAAPVERGSIKIRKDLLLLGEAHKVRLKQKGGNITLTEIVEKALEEYLDREVEK